MSEPNPKAIAAASKPRLSDIPPAVLLEMGIAARAGADEYGRFDWRRTGAAATTYYDAIQRHLLAWMGGEDRDPKSGALHLAAIMSSCSILIDSADQGVLEDDRIDVGKGKPTSSEGAAPADESETSVSVTVRIRVDDLGNFVPEARVDDGCRLPAEWRLQTERLASCAVVPNFESSPAVADAPPEPGAETADPDPLPNGQVERIAGSRDDMSSTVDAAKSANEVSDAPIEEPADALAEESLVDGAGAPPAEVGEAGGEAKASPPASCENAPQLTIDEKVAVWAAYQGGEMPAAIAARLSQPRVRISNLIASIKLGKVKLPAAIAEPPDAVEAPAPPAVPEVTKPRPAPELPKPSPDSSPAYAEAQAPDDEDGWSPAEDVTVLRGFGQGNNSYLISQKLPGRSAADVVSRYRALVPRPGVVAQAEALKRAEGRRAATASAAE